MVGLPVLVVAPSVVVSDGLVGEDGGLVGVPDCEVGLTDGGLVDCVVMR